MKFLMTFAMMVTSTVIFSKTLTVDCSSPRKSLKMVSEIANINTPQVIKSLSVNGKEVSKFRDISKMPIYSKDGSVFSLTVQYGQNLYSTAKIKVSSCNDSFEATGSTTLSEYVGGFAGSMTNELTCSCDLK